MPMLRPWAFTLRQSSATSLSERRCSAAAPHNFFGQHRHPHPAPARRVQAVFDRDVIVDNHRFDLNAFGAQPVPPPFRSSSHRRCNS